MYCNSGLIPARFLILISHFAICVTFLWNSKESVRSYSTDEASVSSILSLRMQLVTGLSVAVALMCFEMLAFVIGLTLFNHNSAMLSLASHSVACVWLCHVLLDSWEYCWFWWIFVIGSVIPFLYDVVAVLQVLIQKKY